MERLEGFLKRFGRRGGSRAWSGPRPDVRRGAMAGAVAAMVGYPAVEEPRLDRLLSVDRSKAAQILARIATTSLAYGRFGPPRESYRKIAIEALQDLEADAAFLTNADWVATPSIAVYATLSGATFDAGVIGFDDRNAFIYWVEEED